MLVRNQDARPKAYDEMMTQFRPSHADFTYQKKFGIRNHEGGGRSSARETIARVAAGAIAQKILSFDGVSICAYVERIHDLQAPELEEFPTLESVEASPTRCPAPEIAKKMGQLIIKAKKPRFSGRNCTLRIPGLPIGWGLHLIELKLIYSANCPCLPPKALKWAVAFRVLS